MVVLIIDQLGPGFGKAERHPPVAIDPHRPMPSQIAFKRVQLERWHVHGLRPVSSIQKTQNTRQLGRMSGLDAPRRAGAIEGFEALMAKADNHAAVYRVALRLSIPFEGLDPQSPDGIARHKAGEEGLCSRQRRLGMGIEGGRRNAPHPLARGCL